MVIRYDRMLKTSVQRMMVNPVYHSIGVCLTSYLPMAFLH